MLKTVPPYAVGLEFTIIALTCGFSLRPGLSAGDVVLAREPAEDLFSADLVLAGVDLSWPGVSLCRCELTEGTVRPGGVVVLQVFGQHPAQVVLIDDKQPVQGLPA